MFLEISMNNGTKYIRVCESVRIVNPETNKSEPKRRTVKNIGPLSHFDDGKPDYEARLKASYAAGNPIIDELKRVREEQQTLLYSLNVLTRLSNSEFEVLYEFLEKLPGVMAPGGRAAILTFHSGEDRLVKNFLKSGNLEGKVEKDFYGNPLTPFKLVSRKAIVPDEAETSQNSRARSAKLRIAEKN